jgi:hypothetical protein
VVSSLGLFCRLFCRLVLPTGFANWFCQLVLPTGFANWICQLVMPIELNKARQGKTKQSKIFLGSH